MRRTSTLLPGGTGLFILAFLFVQPLYGQFSDQRLINTQAAGANFVRAGDLNGDGYIDLVSASPDDNKIAWYRNLDGFGSFGSEEVISLEAMRVNSIHLADLDGDGDLDVLSASRDDNAVGWHANLGNGTFENRRIISTDLFVAMSVVAGDLDGDGDLDVISASRDDDKIAWYEHLDGSGTFGPQQVINTSSLRAFAVHTADLDGDGDLDILSASELDDKIAWYENLDGSGTFSTQYVITTDANSAHDVTAADIDGDGDLDVVSASAADHKIAWYRNTDGSGTFSGELVLTTDALFAHSVSVADVDVDGDLDVLSASINDSKLAWYPNLDGAGSFGVQRVISTSGSGATSIIAANLDGDEDPDVVSASMFDNKIAWYESFAGRGRVQFGFLNDVAFGATESHWPRSVHAADLDGDRDLDILSASFNDNKIAWYENVNGVFSDQRVITNAADGAQDVQAADIDGDGDLDVISASGYDNSIKWYENFDGNGSFDVLREVSTGANNAYAVNAADIDGDGDMDLVSASFDDDTIAWYENLDGNGLFGPLLLITKAAKGATDVVAADINGDGYIDVVSASSFDDKIAWYRNLDGSGTFGSQELITDDAELATSVHVADIDGDGDLDVMSASGGDDKIAWYENLDGLGVFSQGKVISLEAQRAFSVYAADLDVDGDLDVISASRDDNKIAWYENLDAGRFGAQQIISSSVLGARSVYAADLDNDGDPDVLSASQNDNRVAWYENFSIISTSLDAEDEVPVISHGVATSFFPNPAISSGNLKVAILHSQHVSIMMYDVQGREVARLFNGFLTSGEHVVPFRRSSLPTGMYLIRIQGEEFMQIVKIALL